MKPPPAKSPPAKSPERRADAGARDALERRAAGLFEDSVARLDAHTCSELTQARHAALDELKHGLSVWRWLRAPAGALAAAAFIAIALLLGPAGERIASGPAPVAPEDFAMVANAENLEMLEDVEFYAWLGEQ